MTTLYSFEGAADDTAVVIVDGEPSDYDAYNGAQFHLINRHGRMQITLDVDDNSGCWEIGLGQTSEAHPMPDWPVAVCQSPEDDHSARVTITTPAGTELVWIQ